MVRTCVALVFATLLVTVPVAAQTFSGGVSTAVAAVASADDPVTRRMRIRTPADARPLVLPPLYASLAALQGYDSYSTLRALNQGAVEANPMMRGVAGNSAAIFVAKSASTFASVYVSERLWRGHRRGAAIVLMVAANGIMAVVAAQNAAVLRGQR